MSSRRVIIGRARAARQRETAKHAADVGALIKALDRAAEPGPGVIKASDLQVREGSGGATLVLQADGRSVIEIDLNLAALRFLAESAASIVQHQSKPRVVATVKHR